MQSLFKRVAQTILAMALSASVSVLAHGAHTGALELDHPYAVPSVPGEPHGKAFLRGIKNTGAQADRLLSASTPVAQGVELFSLKPDATGHPGMALAAIVLPAKSTTLLRHTGDYQLSLIALKQALKDGDRFDLTLNFERAGTQTVKVWVQTPREVSVGDHNH